MKWLALFVSITALVLAQSAGATRQHPASQHVARWHHLSLNQKRVVVVKTIARERAPLRWWLHARSRLPASASGRLVYCASVGTRLPGVICVHAYRMVNAVHVLRRIDSRLAAFARARQRQVPLTGDWLTAVRQVQRVFPGSEPWLVSCSSGEGGHGAWVWFGHAASPRYGADRTPGGWLQYMQGTFWTDYRQAVADARSRGFVVPSGSASYTSATGMALAGGWAYSHARPPGKWTGGGC